MMNGLELFSGETLAARGVCEGQAIFYIRTVNEVEAEPEIHPIKVLMTQVATKLNKNPADFEQLAQDLISEDYDDLQGLKLLTRDVARD